jgi:hypothetical protein
MMDHEYLTPDDQEAIEYVARRAVDGYRDGLRARVEALRETPDLYGGYREGWTEALDEMLDLIGETTP